MRTILIAGVLAVQVAAQPLTEPPLLVQLIRQPGAGGASVRRYADAKAALDVLGMTAITGPAETWFMEQHDSFASIEALDNAVRSVAPERAPNDQPDQFLGDLLAASRSLIAMYRPGWSYRPDQAIRMFPKARYFHVSIYRVRSGAEGDFAETVKLRRGIFDSINLDRPELAYQVISGASMGTYLFLAPLTSLKSLDEGLARVPVYTAPAAKAGSKVAAESEISRGNLLFRVEPRISYVSDDFAAEAPEFWRSNPKSQ